MEQHEFAGMFGRLDRIREVAWCSAEVAAEVLEQVIRDMDQENFESLSNIDPRKFDRMAVERVYEHLVTEGGSFSQENSMLQNLEAAKALQRTIEAYQDLAGYSVDLHETLPAEGFCLMNNLYPEQERWDVEVKRRSEVVSQKGKEGEHGDQATEA